MLLSGLLLLYPVRHVDGFATQLRINVGSNLLDLVLAVLVLQPLILSINRNAVRWRNRLDYRDVIRRIERATDQVDIWKYWTGLLESRRCRPGMRNCSRSGSARPDPRMPSTGSTTGCRTGSSATAE